MPRSKKMSMTSYEFLMMLLDKQLERYSKTWLECEGIYEETGVPPYYQYSFNSKEEFEEWKTFCIEQMRNSKQRISKKEAEKRFNWIHSMYGLIENFQNA